MVRGVCILSMMSWIFVARLNLVLSLAFIDLLISS